MAAEREKSEDTEGEPSPESLQTVGARLRWAIDRRPKRGREYGQALFAKDMEARAAELAKEGVRLQGWTLPSVQSYVHERTDPSLLFLQEAARLCRVREPWLISGQGEATKERQEAAKREAAAVDSKGDALRFLRDVLRGMVPYPSPDEDGYLSLADPASADAFSARVNLPGIPVWLAPLSEVCRRTGLDGEEVGRLLAAPVKEAGVRFLALKGDALTNYIMAMIPVLFTLADYRVPREDRG